MIEAPEIALATAAAENRRFLVRVYSWMAGGLALTGAIAFLVASNTTAAMTLARNPILFYGLLFGELGAVFAFAPLAKRFSSNVAALVFFAYAALNGVTFSILFLVYTADSIYSTFFIAAGTFAAVSAFGMTTKRDLTGVGHFMMMGLFGIIIASFANLLLASDGLAWVTSFLGVFIFTGLTAYHTQKILAQNVTGNEGTDDDVKEAISGALVLYLDFINLFLNLLRLMGRRK
jgi:hypothetical protein